jgi:SNF2 family DNA or RNA helicase
MQLDVVGSRLLCTDADPKDQKMLMKFYGASKTTKGISFPIEPLVVRYFIAFVPSCELSKEVQKFYNDFLVEFDKLMQIKQGEWTNYSFPSGNSVLPLKEHQRIALAFFTRNNRFILGDEMGLGKSCSALMCAFHSSKKVLIICPSYLKYNWYREIEKWLGEEVVETVLCDGDRSVRELGIKLNKRWTIVNYEMLRPQRARGGYPELFAKQWDMVIIDEAHRTKNPKAQQVVGIKKLKTTNMIMLTGNPVGNYPQDIWQLLNILYPKRFTSLWTFIDYFCDQIDAFFSKEIVGIKKNKLKELQYILQPVLLRRMKEGLPEKIHKDIYVKMQGKQLKAYREAKQFKINKIGGDLRIIDSKLEMIIRLQQIVANPSILEIDASSIIEETILQLISDIGKTKFIVGTKFVVAAQEMYNMLLKADIPVSLITGNVKAEMKDKIIENFKRQPFHVLVGNIDAMSEGLNLDECDHMIFADKSWSPATNQQFEDRIHRMNSTRNKYYYHIIVSDSVSEKREKMLREKTEMLDSILRDKELVDEIYCSVLD